MYAERADHSGWRRRLRISMPMRVRHDDDVHSAATISATAMIMRPIGRIEHAMDDLHRHRQPTAAAAAPDPAGPRSAAPRR